MKSITLKSIFWTTVAASLMLVTTQSLFADDGKLQYCKILKIRNSCWITQDGQGIKKSAREGDELHEGDTIEVRPGNFVQLAFDDSGKNVIQLEGHALAKINMGQLIRFDLEKGKVFALLDTLHDDGRRFEVHTPEAVAAVRGTYFEVEADGGLTQAAVYKGRIRMQDVSADGTPTMSMAMMNAGQIMEVNKQDKKLSQARVMTEKEFEGINRVIDQFEFSRPKLDYAKTVQALKEDGAITEAPEKEKRLIGQSNNDEDVKLKKEDTNSAGKDQGFTLF